MAISPCAGNAQEWRCDQTISARPPRALTGLRESVEALFIRGGMTALIGARKAVLLGGVPGWVIGRNAALRDVDLKGNRYWRAAPKSVVTDLLSTARSSTAYLADAGGIYQSFGNNVLARIDGVGAEIDGQFINKIRNPRGEGGVIGTVGVTNKCTGYNAKPTTAVGIPTSGDAAGVVSIVDSTSALEAIAGSNPFIQAGLANGWLSGQVWRGDNNAGTGSFYVKMPGACGNTNNHSVRGLVRLVSGSGSVTIGIEGGGVSSAATSNFTWLTKENSGVGNASYRWQINIPAGCVAEWILFSLEEASAAAPVPTVVAGSSATGALPTNWVKPTSAPNMPWAFMGTGTEDGLPYTDMRVVGTAAASGEIRFDPESATYATASPGQAWGADCYMKKIAGTCPAAHMRFNVAGGSLSNGADVTLDGTRQRVFARIVLSTGATALVAAPAFYLTGSTAYDFTIRIYAPKLVQVAVVEGPELVTNGDFASGAGWTLDAGWSISGGVLNAAAPAGFANARTPALQTLVAGQIFKSVFSVASVSAAGSGVYSQVGGSTGAVRTTVGTYTDYIVTTAANQNVNIVPPAGGGFTGTIDNFSVKQVSPGYLPTYPILPPVGTPGDSTQYASDVTAVQAMEGPNLLGDVCNPFTTTDGWVPANCTLSIDNGSLVVTSLGGSNAVAYKLVDVSPGKPIRFIVDADYVSGNQYTIALRTPDGSGPQTAQVISGSLQSYTDQTVVFDYVPSAYNQVRLQVGVQGTSSAGSTSKFGRAVAQRLTPFAGALVADIDAGATEIVVPNWSHTGDGVNRPLFEYVKDANNYIRGYINASDKPALKIVQGGVTQTDTAMTTSIASGRKPLAFGWSASGGYIGDAAGNVATFGAVTLPSGISSDKWGSSQAGNYLNDILERRVTLKNLSQSQALSIAATA